jgi:coproporphyrinogen III oxidase
MNGKVFEKVGVNVSTVGGQFSPEFAKSIFGADEENPGFFATGISLVAHMANPHVPAVHMNTRFLATTRRWFGGGADLNPAIPYRGHRRLPRPPSRRLRCARPDLLPAIFQVGRRLFLPSPPRRSRAASAAFSTTISNATSPAKGATFEQNFAFTRDVGEAFLDIFPAIVRKRMETPFSDEDMDRLLEFRGRYVEFNLLYDRGTLFGLKTGGNIDAILMSLPPLARWKLTA